MKSKGKRRQSSSQSYVKQRRGSLWYKGFVGITALGLVVLAGSMTLEIIGIFQEKSAIEKEKDDFLAQISYIEQESSKLSQLQEFLKTDEYLEREAKQSLDKSQSGEEVRFITPGKIVDDMSDKELIRTLKDPRSKEMMKAETNPEKWWAFFFDKERLNEQSGHHRDN